MSDFIDLSLLPLPDAVETLDVTTIVNEMLDALAVEDTSLAGISESDPSYHTIQVCALREVALRARINDAVRAALLTTSYGTNLEHHGARDDVQRLVFEDEEGNEVTELDADYKQRIFQAARATGAGVREAYESAALATDARIYSVLARSPSPAVVHIEWVPEEDVDPADHPDIQAAIVATMTADAVKMLADSVTVTQCTAVDVPVEALLQMEPGPDPALAMTTAEAALRAWGLLQQRSRYPLPLFPLAKALQVVGVVGVVLTLPAADQPIPVTAAYYRISTVTLSTEVAPWLA